MRLAWRRVHVPAFTGAALATALGVSAPGAAAQSVSLWLDANAAHTQPPSGTMFEAANYGLLGARFRADLSATAVDAGVTAGRGAHDGSGAWLSGRGAVHSARVAGRLDYGIRAEASGLSYLAPVRMEEDYEYAQWLYAGGVMPFAGISIGRFRLAGEIQLTRGAWRSELASPATEGGAPIGGPGLPGLPGPPLPGNPAPGSPGEVVETRGDVAVSGGAVSLMRVFGPATLEVRGTRLDVKNDVANGTHAGVDATLALSLGAADLSAGVRRWDSPAQTGEFGGHVGVGFALGEATWIQAVASRTVTDVFQGVPGGTSLSVGVSLRIGHRPLGPPPPARVGARSGAGHSVRFTYPRTDARSVSVAGDFTGWEPRSLQRSADGTWTLDTVVMPGIYHYSFVVDGEWTVPPTAQGVVDDGFGQKNATLVVSPQGDGQS
jgi:hypothetical protein